jgi:arabinan endo-1,5-alpha-L-arabinosidase
MKSKSRLAGLLAVLVQLGAAGAVTASPDDPGQVEISGWRGAHDPTIVEVGGKFVRIQTGHGVPISTSPDLREWKSAGQVFAKNPAWMTEEIPGAIDIWAPDLVFRAGEWRMYYAVSTFGSNRSAIGLVVNRQLDPDNPSAGWEDRGPVFESFPTDNYNAIDPQIASADGQDWLVFGSFWGGIKMVRLDERGLVISGAPLVAIAARPEAPHAIEGAYIFQHAGKFYLFVSFDFCCRGKLSNYHIRVGRSDALTGPYVDRDGVPLLQGGGSVVKTSDNRDFGPGHNSILVTGGKEYIVYHVYDGNYGGLPFLRIQQLNWDADGWPVAPHSP